MVSLNNNEKNGISEIIDDFVEDPAECWSLKQRGGHVYYWYEEARKLGQSSTKEFIIGILFWAILVEIANYIDLSNNADVKWESAPWDEIIELLRIWWIEIENKVTTLQRG